MPRKRKPDALIVALDNEIGDAKMGYDRCIAEAKRYEAIAKSLYAVRDRLLTKKADT